VRVIAGENHQQLRVSSNRAFGLFFSSILTFLGLFLLVSSRVEIFFVLQALSIILFVISLTVDNLLGPINRVWAQTGLLLSKITNPIILSIVFFLIVVPYAMVSRLLKRDVLEVKSNVSTGSYWKVREEESRSIEWLKRQY